MSPRVYAIRVALVLVLLASGVFLFRFFAGMARPPATDAVEETALDVEAVRVAAEDVPVVLSGLGTLRTQRKSLISAEVGGRVVRLHSRFLVGEVVAEGVVLVELDGRDYQLALDRARADERSLAAELEQMAQEERNNRRQLEIARASLALAERDLERMKEMVEAGGRAETARDQAELALNQKREQVVALENALELLPARRERTGANLERARQERRRAELALEKTVYRAPFQARLEAKHVELEQYVAPGSPLLLLSDDRVLELPVSLEGRLVKRWLLPPEADPERGWFGALPATPVAISWTQDEGTRGLGRLDRVESYDATNRTVQLVVVWSRDERQDSDGLLTAGMFCRAAIPGRPARGVFRLPRSAVSHDGTVLLVRDGRLATRPVAVEHEMGQAVLVSDGLADGDVVVVARPPRVLEGLAVRPIFADTASEAPQ